MNNRRILIMVEVNALGEGCPIPVVKTKKAFEELTASDIVVTRVSLEMQAGNVAKLAEKKGYEAIIEKISDEEWTVTTKVVIDGAAPAEECCCCGGEESCTCSKKNVVVTIGSAKMGEGSDELGHILMKAMGYALNQLDPLPDTVIFYNGGAYLTCEGSPILEDVKTLAAEGVEILTCGTCLDFYGLKDKLAVGGVTNMYSIVEILSKASHVVKP